MEMYLGVKVVKASQEMSRREYCDYRGWPLPSDENGDDRVYLVEYEKDENSKQNHPDHEGYISMSPKEVFDKAYRRIDGLTFGLAIEALKQGKCIARKGWNGKGMFVFKQIPAEIGLDIIPKMQSVPDDVKRKMMNRVTTLKYSNQMAIVHSDGRVDSWVASSSDTFADDWCIVE